MRVHIALVVVAPRDAATGTQRWELQMNGPLWSSPVVVDNTLIQGDCAGNLNAFDLTAANDGTPPPKLWSVFLGGCIESTPAVWDGRIFVGTRMGRASSTGHRDSGSVDVFGG